MEWEEVRDAFGQAHPNRKYKRCGKHLVELEACTETKTNECRSDVADRRFAKFRASQLKPTRILSTLSKQWVDEIEHVWINTNVSFGFQREFPITYKVGYIARPTGFDDQLDRICAPGIHYFNTLLAAFMYRQGASLEFNDNGSLRNVYRPLLWANWDNIPYVQKRYEVYDLIYDGIWKKHK